MNHIFASHFNNKRKQKLTFNLFDQLVDWHHFFQTLFGSDTAQTNVFCFIIQREF